MGNHIHFKDGKYAIWSTIVDQYTTEWTDDETYIVSVWLQMEIYRALNSLKSLLPNARKHGCSIAHGFRCSKEDL